MAAAALAPLPAPPPLPDDEPLLDDDGNTIANDADGVWQITIPAPVVKNWKPPTMAEMREQEKAARRLRVRELMQEQGLDRRHKPRRRRGKKKKKKLDPLDEEATKIAELKRRKRLMKTVKVVAAFAPAPAPEPEPEPELTYDDWLEHYAGGSLDKKEKLEEWEVREDADPLAKLAELHYDSEDGFNGLLQDVFGDEEEEARSKFSAAVTEQWIERAVAVEVQEARLAAVQQRLLLARLATASMRTSHFTHMTWDTTNEVIDEDGVGHGGDWVANVMADQMTAEGSALMALLSTALPDDARSEVVTRRNGESDEKHLQAEVAACLEAVINLVIRPPGYSYILRRDFTHPIWGIRKIGDAHSGDTTHCTMLLRRSHMHNGWARQGKEELADTFTARLERIQVCLEKEWRLYGYSKKLFPSHVLIEIAMEAHFGHAGRALESLLPSHVLDSSKLDAQGRRKSRRPSALPKFLRRGSQVGLTPPATPRITGSDKDVPPPGAPRGVPGKQTAVVGGGAPALPALLEASR